MTVRTVILLTEYFTQRDGMLYARLPSFAFKCEEDRFLAHRWQLEKVTSDHELYAVS
jgi:hypothetical protein